jgi:hypothetical protein
MPYPTVDEIVARSTDANLLALDSEQQEALWAVSIQAIELYTGQSFAGSADKALEVEATLADVLYLPERLTALESVIPTGGDPLETTAIAITHDGGRLKFRRNVVGVGYYQQALQEVSGYSYPTMFSEGFVTVAGTWGWEDCPPAVIGAIQWDMEESAAADANALTATVNYMRAMGIERISQGNLDLALAPRPTVSPRVQSGLDAYVFLGTPSGRLV